MHLCVCCVDLNEMKPTFDCRKCPTSWKMRKKKVNERFIFTDVLYLEKSLSMEINDGDVLSEISSIKLKKFSEGKKKR